MTGTPDTGLENPLPRNGFLPETFTPDINRRGPEAAGALPGVQFSLIDTSRPISGYDEDSTGTGSATGYSRPETPAQHYASQAHGAYATSRSA
jgi:hypothetical protein